jgi:fermentation-respiration switch protein FrsA (DUF1100 family)
VPADQVDPLRTAVRRFLWASYLDRVDKKEAEHQFASLREESRALPEPTGTLVKYINDRDVGKLGPRLQPHIRFYVDQAALSPARSPVPSSRVFLLHGRDDNVIPSAESRRLAARLRRRVPVRLLVTDLVSHADADRPPRLLDVLNLADFWGELLSR